MTTAKEQFKNDLHKDPEDLEREADGVRAELEGKVDQLMHQLSPSQLINQGMTYFRESAYYDFARNIAMRLENNPIPTVLAGVGLVWLITASRQPSTHHGQSLKSSSRDAAERTKEAGHKVAEGASDVMHRVSDASRQTAESARDGLHNAREGYTQMLQERPLLVGALAVAAGATLGALLPRTSTEDRVMGELSDRGADALKAKTEEKLQAAQSQDSSETEEGEQASTGGKPPPAAKTRSSEGASGKVRSSAGKASRQSEPQPPPGAGQDSTKTYHGTSY